MRALSPNTALAALLAAFLVPSHAAEAPKAAEPAAPVAKAAPAAPAAHAAPQASAPAAQAAAKPAAPASQAASAQPVAEGVAVQNAPAAANGTGCDEVKAGIDAKLKAKGVKAFTLDVVAKEDVKDAKVVGSCEGGKKKITYKRG